MKSNSTKGFALEKIAAKFLREQGYQVEVARRQRFLSQDLFGCWDIVAVNQYTIRFIQISMQQLYDRGKAYKQTLIDFKIPFGSKEYWKYNKENKTWSIQWKEVVDHGGQDSNV